MPRSIALVASGLFLAVATSLLLTGCGTGSIHTQPMVTSGVRLTPNPPKIYIAPFDTSTGRWLVGREGIELVDFKKDFQTNFVHQLEVRLNKLAPAEPRWVDDLPDHGWLVAGEFIAVDQGSRALRTAVGAGAGETTLQTKVYVYDLSISKTEYIMSFRTGVPDEKEGTGSGSGTAPAGLTAAGEPILTGMGLGSGLKLDTTRTCREICDVLKPYL
ncbi:MAG: DUF4410 domain-containing protein [Methylacidiphilales bacterium]|nr:DUF4410 domain-containing protein [Candidatus Methylacidiphilales bacterium]